MTELHRKPLGGKCYGHIPHIPGSGVGPGDHKCSEGQARIATEKARDKHDRIICSEKVDGSNVGIAKLNGEIIALTRAGYRAYTSPYEQHHIFAKWVNDNKSRFDGLLRDGERVCGEWLAQAHGTRYDLPHEPFVVFDIMSGQKRCLWNEVLIRTVEYKFVMPAWIHYGSPLSVKEAMKLVEKSSHGAIDIVEGVVWRIERNHLKDKHSGQREWSFDFICKYVRPDKEDGKYLPEISGKEAIWNWKPSS
jgi:hypothetical protein